MTASSGVTLDSTNPNFEFIREFGMNGLWKSLNDFGCGPFESSRFIEWFWRRSESWRPFKSQTAFTAYARERVSDEVGYTRRKLDAENTVARYFDKGDNLTFEDVMTAVTFCGPTQPMPYEVFENEKTAIVDVTRRAGDDKFLKIEKIFLPTLVRLYPWERRESRVIKTIPVGSTSCEFDLATLAFWFKYRNARRDEMQQAIAFHSADQLDWTDRNLYSRWREGIFAERYKNRVDPVLDACVPVAAGKDVYDAKPGKQALVMPLLKN
jgi:hypothetical protein